MPRRFLALALLTALPLVARAQAPVADSTFHGRCGDEVATEKWALTRTEEKFDNYSRVSARPNFWFADDEPKLSFMTFAERIDNKEGSSYVLWLVFTSPDWLFISDEPGSLVVLADSSRLSFSTTMRDIHREVVPGVGIKETVLYGATREALRALAASEKVEARVRGRDHEYVIAPKQPEFACAVARLVRESR